MAPELRHRPRTVAMELEGEPLFVTTTGRGDLSALMTLRGEVLETIRYSAYGEKSVYGEGLSPWGFAGKRLDESGLSYFGHRYYSADLKRWLSPDPIGFADGPNLYSFCRNNPYTFIDWLGLRSESGRAKGDELYGRKRGGLGTHSEGGNEANNEWLKELLAVAGATAKKWGKELKRCWNRCFHGNKDQLQMPASTWFVDAAGIAQCASGVIEARLGRALSFTPLAPVGWLLMVHGFDHAFAGAYTACTGQPRN